MYQIHTLRECPHMQPAMAQWFHEKWGAPLQAYQESMEDCLAGGQAYPQWYVAMENGRIIGGLGVIENDFHNRKDLKPNVCAVYTEPDCRGRGIAGALLGHVCEDMHRQGIDTLYLVTDHTSFYERYGWEYFCAVLEDGAEEPARLYVHRYTPRTPETL